MVHTSLDCSHPWAGAIFVAVTFSLSDSVCLNGSFYLRQHFPNASFCLRQRLYQWLFLFETAFPQCLFLFETAFASMALSIWDSISPMPLSVWDSVCINDSFSLRQRLTQWLFLFAAITLWFAHTTSGTANVNSLMTHSAVAARVTLCISHGDSTAVVSGSGVASALANNDPASAVVI